jgi:transcriptional regulator with XRE-family HTH domain
MSFSSALRHTMSEFRLTGTELSSKSGVSRNTISAFRQGGQAISVDNLEKLLGAMSEDARRYFFSQLQGVRYSQKSEEPATACAVGEGRADYQAE